MPGTIQVSVLGMEPPPSPDSLVSVKVAVGKREYQTWDNVQFSLPIMSLRDNLIFTFHDDDGKEISRTDVETKSVVLKGLWDDLFPLKGGGWVHMKLQFLLNEVERKRIKDMRETVVRKKQQELVKSSLTHTETFGEVSIESSVPHLVHHCEELNSSPKVGEGTPRKQPKETTPDGRGDSSTSQLSQNVEVYLISANNSSERISEAHSQPTDDGSPLGALDPLSKSLESSCVGNNQNSRPFSVTLEEDTPCCPEPESSTKVSPSNVRKMIGAFESSLTQGSIPHFESMVKSKLSKMRKEDTSKVLSTENGAVGSVKEKTNKKQFTLGLPGEVGSQQGSHLNIPRGGREQNRDSYVCASGESRRMNEDILDLESLSNVKKDKAPSDGRSISVGFMDAKIEIGALDAGVSTKSSQQLELNSAEVNSLSEGGTDQEHQVGECTKDDNTLFQDINFRETLNEEMENREISFSESHSGTATREEDNLSSPLFACPSGTNEPSSLCIVEESEQNARTSDSEKLSLHPSSDETHKQEGYDEVLCGPSESPLSWIFQDDTRHLCITTISKQVRNLVETGYFNSETFSRGSNFSQAEERNLSNSACVEVSNDDGSSCNLRQSKLGSPKYVSKHVGGLIEQAIRIAIIVACGTIFLSTTKRKTR